MHQAQAGQCRFDEFGEQIFGADFYQTRRAGDDVGFASVGANCEHPTGTVEATLISFTPTPGYVGEDRFEVAFGPNFKVTVHVEVVAAGTGPTTTR